MFLDVVYNHFGPDGNYLPVYAPQILTDRHKTPWGSAINYDGADAKSMREFVIHNALYWLEEFHFDGLRLDAVHAIMDTEMASELNVLARDAGRIARSNRRTSDFTDNILHVALREIVARFPVYRTYIDGTTPSEADRRDLDWAIAQARRAEHAPDASVFDFLHVAPGVELLVRDLVDRGLVGLLGFRRLLLLLLRLLL